MDGDSVERILSIPTEQGDVPIDLADLPLDREGVQDIVGLLSADSQPAYYWATLSYEYLKQHKNEDAAIEFLARGTQVLRMTSSRAHGTALLDAMLASLYADRARSSPKQIIADAKYQPLQGKADLLPKQAHQSHATQFTNAAAGADPRAPHSQLSRAIDMSLKGATQDAERIFTDVSTRQPKNVLALLGRACCLLRRRAFAQALPIYQQALALVLPWEAQGDFSRPDPRIGIGLCLAGLGRVNDARRAWQRSAALYPSKAAPRLLLGLSASNAARQAGALPLGLFGVGLTATEDEARKTAREEALDHIQAAWKLNNKSAMTAVALCDHFSHRAWVLASEENNAAKSTAQFQQALKLGEHAVQYADARSDLIAATASIARTAHLASLAASRSLCNLDEVEMRALANRHWTRVVEDLARAPLPGSSASTVSPLQALAALSLAQLQLGQGEVVAAMHTLDGLRLANFVHLPTTLLEPALLEASLRSASHAGAGKEEVARDRVKSKKLLDRCLNICDAAGQMLSGGSDSSSRKALAASKRSLTAEVVGETTLQQVHEVGQDVLANVELAQILQTGASSGDLPRAARRYASALSILSSRSHKSATLSPSIEIRLRANLGAVLGVRSLESAVGPGYGGSHGDSDEQPQHPLVERSLEHLRAALDLIRAADAQSQPSAEDLEYEKTTVLYNAARLQESSRHATALEEARRAYETILQIHPEYIDARVRLAIMAASLPASDNVRGKATQTANSYFKEALSSDPANLDTRAAYVCFLAGELGSSPYPGQWGIIKDTLAELFLGPNDDKAARAFGGPTAARQVADAATQDPFIMSAMGWAYYNLGREARDKKERERCMFRAGEFFSQALANDRRCAIAAQGLGILLCDDGLVGSKLGSTDPEAERDARKKAVDEALSVFGKLREVRQDGSIHVCLGHALGRREDWARSSKSYEIASRQYYDDLNPHVLTSWAFAEYHMGLATRSFDNLSRSVERLKQARQLFQTQKDEIVGGSGVTSTNGEGETSTNPRVLSIEAEVRYNRYNEAVIKQKSLQMLLEVRKEERSLEELQEAARGIEEGLTIFQGLTDAAQAGQLNVVSAEMLEQRIQFGESLRDRQAPTHIADQEAFEREVAEKSQAVKALRAEKETAKREAEEAAAAEEAKRLEEIKEMRRKAIEEAREFKYRSPTPELIVKKSSGGKKGGEGGGSKKRGRKRGASSEVETDEDERVANERILSDDEDLAVMSDDDDLGDESAFVGEDGVVDEAARSEAKQRRKLERKKAKLEELRAARIGTKGSKKSSSSRKKDKSSKRGGAQKARKSRKSNVLDSDEEGEASAKETDDEEGGASDEGPKRKKKKRRAAVVDDDVIDTDEEI